MKGNNLPRILPGFFVDALHPLSSSSSFNDRPHRCLRPLNPTRTGIFDARKKAISTVLRHNHHTFVVIVWRMLPGAQHNCYIPGGKGHGHSWIRKQNE
jgi:hypothetical protein